MIRQMGALYVKSGLSGRRVSRVLVLSLVMGLGARPSAGQSTRPGDMVLGIAGGDESGYYVSPNGSPLGNGTAQKPWPSVEYALERVGGGNTIVLLPGVYRGPVVVRRVASGKPGRPTIIRAQKKWEAVIVGSEHHGVLCEEGAGWLVFDGLRVMGALWNGIRLQGDYCIVRNCWIHNCEHQGISAHGRTGTVIERCVIEYNGRHPTQDHGIYADGRQILVRSCIVRHNSGFGIHLYPAAEDCLVVNNLVHGHVYRFGIIVESKVGGNKVLFNTVVDDDGAIMVKGGRGNVVANNIALGRNASVQVKESPDAKLEGNLTSGDPGFVDAAKDVYWLRADARARGAARFDSADQFTAPGFPSVSVVSEDFFGRLSRRTDVGAFQYDPALENPQLRSAWVAGWPYQLKGVLESAPPLPDFWSMPRGK